MIQKQKYTKYIRMAYPYTVQAGAKTLPSAFSTMKIPDTQIYKVHLLDNTGDVFTTILFSRGYTPETPSKDRREISVSDQQIHLDDSIRTVKQKILAEITRNPVSGFRYSYEEMYLFGDAHWEDNTKVCIGIRSATRGTHNTTLDNMDIDGADIDSAEPDTHTTTANPYSMKNVSEITVPKRQYVYENSLLLNYDLHSSNDIYVCFAENVLEFVRNIRGQTSDQPDLSTVEEHIIQLYFPLLYDQQIYTLDILREKRRDLITRSLQMITENQYSRSGVQMFYDIYNSSKTPTHYIQKGVDRIRFVITPNNGNSVQLPLEMIFKRIQSSRVIPFIKYNPGNRRENLYRLFYDRITADGRKIPILSHKQISKLAREIGKLNQIAIYVNSVERDVPVFYIHFEHTGEITVSGVHAAPIELAAWDKLISTQLNPIFDELNRAFHQTGYKIPYFQKLHSPNIRILQLKYIASTSIEKSVRISEISCIYHILSVSRGNSRNDEPDVRYKRVENYTEMDAETALIAEIYNESKHTEMDIHDIISLLAERFGKTEEYARARLIEYFKTDAEILRTNADHPGFPLRIQVANFQPILEFEVENIDSIHYLKPLEVYIESIIQITQKIAPTGELGKYIRSVCSKNAKPEQLAMAAQTQVANVITTGIPKDTVMGKRVAVAAIQPFMFADDEPDDDFFKKLGIKTPDNEDISKPNMEESTLAYEEELTRDEVDDLFNKLYENNNIGNEPVSPSAELVAEKAPKESTSPTEIADEKTSDKIPETEREGAETEPAKKSPAKESPAKENEEEDDDEDLPKNAIFYDDEDSPEGGAPKRREKRSVAQNADGATIQPPNANLPDLKPDYRPLKQPNPFLLKMQQNEPNLFLSKSQGKFKTYSTACQPTSRHPVMLTDEEKQRIDREFPGSYKHAVKYGTDPEKPYWYICPRYWCFLTNSSISEQDVRDKKCGEIIPEDADVIPPGAYVYEFKGESEDGQPGNADQYPGFLKEGKHPNGYCLPCCFKNWDKGLQKERREKCDLNKPDATLAIEAPGQKRGRTAKPAEATGQAPAQLQSELYIISLDTYPLPKTRWGFLPIPAQLFLNIDYKSALRPNNPALIREDTPVLLRYGVEQIQNQSFVGVFADVYARKRNIATPTVEEFRKILAREITLDIFIKIHNSALVSAFSPLRPDASRPIPNEEIAKYTQTEFGKRLNMANVQEKSFFENTVASYMNFIAYITSPSEPINHTYLWDIFTSNIAGLNVGGLNLILLEIAENDITDKIQYICPTNRYSKHMFDPKLPSVIVLKHDEFYEPIYQYHFNKKYKDPKDGVEKINKGISARSIFVYDKVNENIKQLLNTINHTSNRYCLPLRSLPRVYHFKEPIRLHDLLREMEKHAIAPIAQVVNYRNKVIGVLVKPPEDKNAASAPPNKVSTVMIPCFPSAISDEFKPEVKVLHMNDESIWADYENSRDTLLAIHRLTKGAIPCLPRVKVKEDEAVVGIVTITNQFVQIMPPLVHDIDDGIETEQMANIAMTDNEVATNKRGDSTRISTMHKIRLENQFYAAFRGTIRELLNDYTNISYKRSLTEIIESQSQLYRVKMAKIEEQLRQMAGDKVIFVDIAEDVLQDIDTINQCSAQPSNTKNTHSTPYCVVKENHTLQLTIPKTNLLSTLSKTDSPTAKNDNEKLYFIRMADELLRYQRVRMFMMEPDKYFHLVDVDYAIHPNEMIVSQTAIQSNMFDNLVPLSESSYIHHTNYDTAAPAVHQPYSNDVITLDNQTAQTIPNEMDAKCIHSVVNVIGNPETSIWRRSFPKTAKEMVFKNTVECSYYVLMAIIKSYTGESHSILQIKQKLWEGYSRYIQLDTQNMLRIIEILKAQGKRQLMEQVIQKRMPLDARIFSEEYYISDLDIWVLADSLKLPIILFNPETLKGFSNIYRFVWVLCGGNTREKYYFIRSTLVDKEAKSNGIAKYHLIQPSLALNETREFYALLVKALRGDSEYAHNVWKLGEMLSQRQPIKRTNNART
jgi:hypothetical protein